MISIYYLERNNVPFYVGKATNIVRRKHRHYLTYGRDIKLVVIDNCGKEKQEWKFWEYFYINLFKGWGFKLENKNLKGGGGPTSYSEEIKIRMRKPRREGTGAKISKTLRERNHSQYYTPEVRDKMSKANKGRKNPFTEEHIKNIIISRRKKSKRLYQYDIQGNFIKEWESKGQAAEWIKENNERALNQNIPSQIKDCCFGRMKSCWGYIWRYKDEFIPVYSLFENIYQFNQNKELINQFNNYTSLKEWLINNLDIGSFNAKYSHVLGNNIKNCCKNKKLKLIKGYYWSFNNQI